MKPKETNIVNVRDLLIAKGLITPSDTPPETAECVRCETPFERIAGRTFDTVCGKRSCRRKDAER